jgi:hypothetical protein
MAVHDRAKGAADFVADGSAKASTGGGDRARVLHRTSRRLSVEELIIVCVAPDPKPQNPIFGFDAENPMR